MTESPSSENDPAGDPPPVEGARDEPPQAPVGQDEPNPDVVSDATADEKGPETPVDPGVGGYAGRDPKTEMPRMPSVPETQDDPDREPPASN